MDQRTVPEPWKLALIGMVAGVVGGGLGVGGGIILVPLLLLVGLDRHRAHATSLAAIIFIALAGATSFGISGESELGLGLLVGVGGITGSVIGATVMHRMSSNGLSIFFGIVLLVVAVRMISGATPLAGFGDFGDVLRIFISLGIGLVAGFFAGVAGVGGGVINVPSLVFFLGLTQHQAQGTSLVAIVLTAVAATVVNSRNERVELRDGLMAGVGGVAGSLLGSRLALGVEGRTLSFLFGFLVLFVAVRTLYQAFRARARPASA